MKTITAGKTMRLTLTALFAVIITLCSWLSVPAPVPFTMQTFAVFFSLIMLGGKLGTLSVLLYILLGAVGVPVFHGFTGGIGILLGTSGGYILGFLLTSLVYWSITHFLGNRAIVRATALGFGLAACYAVGTAWYVIVYTKSSGAIGVAGALMTCVVPFIVPDILKLTLAMLAGKRMSRHFNING